MLKATLIGNVVRDPRMASTKMGVAVCSIDIATEKRQKNEDGSKATMFVTVTAWRSLAEICGKYLKRGRKVAFYGVIDEPHVYTGNDGAPKCQLCMTADDVEFIGSKSDAIVDENVGNNQYRQEPKTEQDGFIAVDLGSELPF